MSKTIDENRYKDAPENDEFFIENYDKRFIDWVNLAGKGIT